MSGGGSISIVQHQVQKYGIELEVLQAECIHTWKDEMQTNGDILQTCISCNLQRTITVQ